MKNILVPTDFSTYADHALAFAKELALKHHARLTILHSVYTPHLFDSLYLDPVLAAKLMRDVEVGAKDKLKEIRKETTEAGVEVETVTTCSPLLTAIEDVVRGSDIDLIVMGTKGASGLKEFFVGSNTERIMRLADVPVLAIPDACPAQSIKHIIVPIDYANVTERFMSELMVFQQTFNAKLDFIWVKTHHFMDNDDVMHANFECYARRKFGNIYNIYMKRDVVPESAILRFIDEIDADMVIMPTTQKRGIEHLFLGSTAENVANHSPVPVLGFPVKKGEKILKLDSQEHEEFGEFIL